MLYIYASPETEAGTDRGGEDLFITFSTKTSSLPDLKNPDFEIDIAGEDDHRSIKTEILESAPIPGRPPEEESITRVRWTTYSYEFEWEGGKQELREMVKEAIRDEKNWSRPGLTGLIYEFRWRKYIGGNAD